MPEWCLQTLGACHIREEGRGWGGRGGRGVGGDMGDGEGGGLGGWGGRTVGVSSSWVDGIGVVCGRDRQGERLRLAAAVVIHRVADELGHTWKCSVRWR
jgi:hypothetical protein